ncbi:MerR family transcriptional regulator [Amylibacter sp.]|nr:MerR family transcriptional regulator [Amylibacter sp.]
MARKKDQAFRTITEVSDWLDTPSHVLRFWESKFSQIKPVKRAGGRRYYRPEDLKVIGGIKYLLHDKRTTIAAVKELFKSKGEKYIKEFSKEPIFEEKISNKVLKSPIKLSTEINLKYTKTNVDVNLSENTKSLNSVDKIKLISNFSNSELLQIEELYFKLKRIRNRMKRRLEEI